MSERSFTHPIEKLVAGNRVLHPVPFFSNMSDRCVPASVHSIVAHFLPQADLNECDIDSLCGYSAGMGAWKTQCLLGLAALGFDVLRIEDDGLNYFAQSPLAYMKERFPDPKAYNDQLAHSNIPLEAARVQQYIASGLPFEQRRATRHDITHLLTNGWLVQLFVNGPDLFETQSPPVPHVVLAVGLDAEHVTLHNADGLHGNVAFQEVPWGTFENAWDNHPSGVRGLSAFRWPEPFPTVPPD